MGRTLKLSTAPSTNTFSIKGVSKKKVVKVAKRHNIIKNYFQSLSSNFGLNSSKKLTNKRKRDLGEHNIDVIHLEDLRKPVKQQKLIEDIVSENIKCSESIVSGDGNTFNTKFEYKKNYLQSGDEIKDLFCMDEIKNSNEHIFHGDWHFLIRDEISLEGLDGITLEALWSRLKNTSSHPVFLEGKEELIWNFIKHINQIEYFVLESPRGRLVIYDRNSCVCPESGIVLEPVLSCDDLYPYSMVNKDAIKGSCSTYSSRLENTDIVKNLNLDEALNIYGNRLVIVASQQMREDTIISEISNPNLELVENEYGLLERVGRSRNFGELTQGKVSILNMIKDSRSIFHIRKSLEKKKLLKKQFFILRSLTASQNKTGKLLHLPRFYRAQKSKTLMLIEEVVELLRQKPDYSLEFGEFKKYFPRSTGVNKIMKMAEFGKYIKTDIFRPYRYLYPNASANEWKYKNKDKEKILRIFQLIDPTVNVSACWDAPDNEQNSDDECIDDESPGNKMINPEFLKEVFLFIYYKGKEGVTLQELEKNIELDYYTIRIAIRKLQAKNVIDSMRSEHGKQRHILYFARCFHSKCIRPMPVSKPMKIPDNLLHKILLPQKIDTSNTVTKESQLAFLKIKYIRSSVLSRSLRCQAFEKISYPSSDMSHEKFVNRNTYVKKVYSINLINETINSKLYKFERKHRRKIDNLPQQSNIIVGYKNDDWIIKSIFMKSVVLGINLNILDMLEGNKNETMGILDDNIDFEAVINDRKSIAFKVSQSYSKDYLLGPAPLIVCEEITSENINVTITLSTPPKQYILDYTSYITFDKNLTSLSIFRTNTILEIVNQSMIICDIYKLQRRIMEIEMEAPASKLGQGKIDKNTLNRLLLKLSSEGYIKIFKLVMSNDEKFKTQWIITHPHVELNHPLLKATQEQMVLKFFLGMDKGQKIVPQCTEMIMKHPKSLASPFDSHEITLSLKKLKAISKTKAINSYKLSRHFGRLLGYQPKFVRLQLLHELLYYLIYEFEPLDKMAHSDIEEVLVHYSPEEFHEVPPIYRKGVDWKMFIPPLPLHKEWDCGWALLCDVILAIPLSLWVKLFHTSLECPELSTYMEHPIRKHYLIKDIPLEFRHVVMFNRRYLHNAVELLYRLCFIGLAQLGPQSPQLKDQIFLYLNKKATLFDTSTSAPSYHKVTPKKYRKIQFIFSSRNNIEEYWCQLWTISMNTPLGQRTVMEGKSVTIENPAYKTVLLDSLKSKTPQQAQISDTGEIPGDKQGAAGLDSSMWAHLKRNWLWSSKGKKHVPSTRTEDCNIRNANIACIKPVSIKYKELMNQNRKIFLPDEHRQFQEFVGVNPQKRKEKNKVIHRKMSFKKKRRRKYALDSKDKSILKKVGKLFRAVWSRKEDSILIICKAASYFLSTNSNKEIVPPTALRDVLHVLCPESKNKTTGACIRRILKLWKMDPVMKRIKDNSSNLINLMEISKHFSPIIFNINRSTILKCPYSPLELTIAFTHLVAFMYKNIVNIERILQGHIITLDYFAPSNIGTFSPILVDLEKSKSSYTSSISEDIIEKDVIRSVLLSSLNGSRLGQNTSYQLFKICMKYSDHLIRAAVVSLRNTQTISMNKNSKIKTTGMKGMPFQLSIGYTYMQKSTFTSLTMHTIYQNYLEIIGKTSKLAEVDPSKSIFRYGRLLARNEIAAVWPNIQYLFNIPDSAYILNPYIEDRTAVTTELALLYQQYLRHQYHQEKADLQEQNKDCITTSFDRVENRCTIEKKSPLEIIKVNVTRLLMSLPCLCNKTINENFSLFMEAKDASELHNYLTIFLESLITISLNLLNTEPDGIQLLQNYIQKFRRSKIIDSSTKELEARVFKMGHIVREFLKNHQLTSIKECFENEYNEGNSKCEEVIRSWLGKSKMKCPKTVGNIKVGAVKFSSVYHSFFKYNKDKAETENCLKSILDTEVDKPEKIPEVNEIIEGMMIPPDSKIRTIPHISELACLLSKDKFPDLNKDEKCLEELRNHFITQYPILEGFVVDNVDELKNLSLVQQLFDLEKKEQLEKDIQRCFIFENANNMDMIKRIRENGGDTTDLYVTEEIITYVYNKGVVGATGEQLKILFFTKTNKLDLITILKILTETFVFLRTGIAEIIFVHNDFCSTWLVETFHLSPQENHMLQASGKDQLQKLKQRIESRIRGTKQMKVLLMPWVRIDGTLNRPLLEKWLTSVLSHCLDFPFCPLLNIFEKFHLVKPVELYFLLEILEYLNCLKIVSNVNPPINLLSISTEPITCPGTVLDNFKDMYTQVHTFSTTCMGFYLDRDFIVFA